MAVARIAAATSAKLYAEVFPARLERGAGLPSVERLAYFAELAMVQLAGIKHLIIAVQADGSAMYTIQSLWTMAREQLDITVIILNNRSYAILNIELERVGADAAGPKAKSQLDLAKPNLDFVHIGNGPHLIEVLVPSTFSGPHDCRCTATPSAIGSTALPR
jgi:Thiamine pyrophosphate enzyme, C-terminal TPP binding domain